MFGPFYPYTIEAPVSRGFLFLNLIFKTNFWIQIKIKKQKYNLQIRCWFFLSGSL